MPAGPLTFGTASIPHVNIHWSQLSRTKDIVLNRTSEIEGNEPSILLLDQDATVVLQTYPDPEQRVLIQTEDRHAVKGYGSAHSQRMFNVDTSTPDNDPIYKESVNLATALAIQVSGRLDRSLGNIAPEARVTDADARVFHSQLPRMSVERWRLISSARLLFDGIELDLKVVELHVTFMSSKILDQDSIAPAFEAFLAKFAPIRTGQLDCSPRARLLHQIDCLAKFVLMFAYVIEVNDCGDMPLRLTDSHTTLNLHISQVRKDLTKRVRVNSYHIFHAVAGLLAEGVFGPRDDHPAMSSPYQNYLWLVSDFGWSVFLNTYGDKDPAHVRPELIRVQRGAPVNRRTGDRKYRIRDSEAFRGETWIEGHQLVNEHQYTQRSAGKVARRTEYWNSRQQEFESALFLKVAPGSEWIEKQNIEPFEEQLSYRSMQDGLWRTYLTPDCGHHGMTLIDGPLSLGSDATAILGWTDARPPCAQRIVVLSTKGDARIRWIAFKSTFAGVTVVSDPEHTMLRSETCYVHCALKHTASMPGRWFLIL